MHNDVVQKKIQQAIKDKMEKVFSQENHESNLIVLPIYAYTLKGIDSKAKQD